MASMEVDMFALKYIYRGRNISERWRFPIVTVKADHNVLLLDNYLIMNHCTVIAIKRIFHGSSRKVNRISWLNCTCWLVFLIYRLGYSVVWSQREWQVCLNDSIFIDVSIY